MQHIQIVICEDAQDAIQKGYNYSADPENWSGVTVEKAVIVKNGTSEGNATIDIIFRDEDGKQYVAMITANLLAMVTGAAIGASNNYN